MEHGGSGFKLGHDTVIAWCFLLFQRTIATSSSKSSSPRLIGPFVIDDEGDMILQSGGNCSSNITVSHLRNMNPQHHSCAKLNFTRWRFTIVNKSE